VQNHAAPQKTSAAAQWYLYSTSLRWVEAAVQCDAAAMVRCDAAALAAA